LKQDCGVLIYEDSELFAGPKGNLHV
jgi:hypothetical protein